MEFFKEGNVSHIKSDMKSVSRSIGLALTTIPYIFAACYWSDYAYQSYDLRQVAKWRMKFSHPVWHMIGVVWPRIRRCCKKTKVDGKSYLKNKVIWYMNFY